MIPVSYLSAYLYCPRKLYLEKVMKVIVMPKEVMVKGMVQHKALELAGKAEEIIILKTRKSMSKEDIRSLYEERYRKVLKAAVLQSRERLTEAGLNMAEIEKTIWPIMFQELRYRSRLVHSFMVSSRLEGKELWDKLIPKVKPEFQIESANLNLKGCIDRIEDYGNSVVPVEIKIGKAPQGVWPGDRIQVAAYIMLLEDQGWNVQKGSIIYNDGTRDIIMNPFLRKEVIDVREKVEQLLASKDMPEKCCNNPKCQACSVKSGCIG